MRTVFDHWKYIFRNIWFVLPFAVMPALFLALSVDFPAIRRLAEGFFFGGFDCSFEDIFHAWSFIRFDSVLGVLYGVGNVVCLIFFTALLVAFAEKHMRIGKRTLSGIFSQLSGQILPISGILLFFIALYELWAVVLSAMLYAVCAIGSRGVAGTLFVFVILVFVFVLLYLISIFYLWLPCVQITGFRAYSAFLSSYRLVVGVRWRLILSLAISVVPLGLLLTGFSFLPEFFACLLAFIVYAFLYPSFVIRMETLYFETDKIDREDVLRSYKEL